MKEFIKVFGGLLLCFIMLVLFVLFMQHINAISVNGQEIVLPFSFSLRSANLPDAPFDYEIESGLLGKHNKITFMYERENGRQYTGRNILLGGKKFEFMDYVKTAKNMNYQRFSFYYPLWRDIHIGKYYIDLSNFSLGIILGLEKWKNPDGLGTVVFKSDMLKILYAKGTDTEIVEMDVLYTYKISEGFSLIPLARMRKHNINWFWQYRIGLNIRII